MSQPKHHPLRRAQRYILTGILTIIPIWLTYKVFEFVLKQLSRVGSDLASGVTKILQKNAHETAAWLTAPWFQNSLAIVLTILVLYLLGWLVTRVIGKRLLELLDQIIERIPLVRSVYGSIKKLMDALQTKPDDVQRVVLIDFPSEHMKTVGFVTRTMTDANTGRQLAAVYVPTTPNPTSGYLEIVPVEKLVSTDWNIDEAMTFIISGGAVAPDRINYDKPTDQE